MASYEDIELEERDYAEMTFASDVATDYVRSFHAEKGRVPTEEEYKAEATLTIDESMPEVIEHFQDQGVELDDERKAGARTALLERFVTWCEDAVTWPEFA